MSIFPNPGDHLVYISGENVDFQTGVLQVFNGQGLLLINKKINSPGHYLLPIDFSNYPAGVYFIEFADEEKTWSGKVVIR